MAEWSELLVDAWRANEQEDYPEARRCAAAALDALNGEYGFDVARHMSRLLDNAVHEALPWKVYKCPRCDVGLIRLVEGEGLPQPRVALSRASRSDNDAEIPICEDCGEREGHSASAANPDSPEKWRTGEAVANPTEWPVPIEQLLYEDEQRHRFMRDAELGELRDVLDEDEL